MKTNRLFVALFTLSLLFACKNDSKQTTNKIDPITDTISDILERTAGYNEFRNPYFGQTHQHTGWSFDEAIYNVRLGPDNSYRHARGEKVNHPSGFEVQLKIPLDFMVVSDHA